MTGTRMALIAAMLGAAVALPAVAAEPGGSRSVSVQGLRSLADHGDLAAQVRIGRMYETGDGTARDMVEAARWYRMAADQGNRAGQAALGRLYATGDGLPRSPLQAYFWLMLAGRAPAPGDGGRVDEILNAILPELTPDQRAEADRAVRGWSPR